MKKMKDKTTAAILAIFLGTFGVHRFYTNQRGLGITYLVLFLLSCGILTSILGLIDGVLWLVMSNEEFNRKFNAEYLRQEVHVHVHGKQSENIIINTQGTRQQTAKRPKPVPKKQTVREKRPVNNPHKITGVQRFKEYDYKGALESFQKSLAIQPNDIATHFNLGCCYSMEEDIEQSLYHLDKAVKLGFKDFDKIQHHDALAFLRSHDIFLKFVDNNYQYNNPKALDKPKKDILNDEPTEILDLNSPVKEKVIITETVKESTENRADNFFKDLFGEIEDRKQVERERKNNIQDIPPIEIEEEIPPTLSPDLLDTLRQLADLKEQGILTEEEFLTQKKRLLG